MQRVTKVEHKATESKASVETRIEAVQGDAGSETLTALEAAYGEYEAALAACTSAQAAAAEAEVKLEMLLRKVEKGGAASD